MNTPLRVEAHADIYQDERQTVNIGDVFQVDWVDNFKQTVTLKNEDTDKPNATVSLAVFESFFLPVSKK